MTLPHLVDRLGTLSKPRRRYVRFKENIHGCVSLHAPSLVPRPQQPRVYMLAQEETRCENLASSVRSAPHVAYLPENASSALLD